MVNRQKIRIILKAYDHKVLDFSAEDIVESSALSKDLMYTKMAVSILKYALTIG